MITQLQPVYIQQKKLKPLEQQKYETPTNQADCSNLGLQEDISRIEGGQPQSNKNFLQKSQPYPFMYAPIVKGTTASDQNSEQKQINCWNILFPQFSPKTFNFIFIIILTLYFLCIYGYHYFIYKKLLGCTLYKFGANFTPKIKYYGHVHRLIISIPMFGSVLQAIISLLTLSMFGFVLEQYSGRLKYILTLLISAFFSNLLSAVIYPYNVSVGSVGFIFGLIALNISFIINKYQEFGQQRNLIIFLFILVVGANFLSMIDTKAIDIAGIVGGFVSGGLFSTYTYKMKEIKTKQNHIISKRFRILQLLCLSVLFIFSVVLFGIIFAIDIDNIDIYAWCT